MLCSLYLLLCSSEVQETPILLTSASDFVLKRLFISLVSSFPFFVAQSHAVYKQRPQNRDLNLIKMIYMTRRDWQRLRDFGSTKSLEQFCNCL